MMQVFSKLSSNVIKSKFFNLFNIFKSSSKTPKHVKYVFFVAFGTSIVIPSFYKTKFLNAKCFTIPNKVIDAKIDDENDSSIYTKLEFYIWKDVFLLIISILAAVLAAIMNISIPLQLGQLINTIHSNFEMETSIFLHSLSKPAIKLVLNYFLQSLSTTVYISVLSIVGERLAMRLRMGIFEKILLQDTYFFDSRQSGDLLNRLISDVQEFKSSFKMIISQGLKSSVQIIGSSIALIYVSKEMTITMAIGVVFMVSVGSIIGRLLRSISKRAQNQLSVAANTANETLVNIRTVKSFAMEDLSIESFREDATQVCNLNQILGIGIGLFQGISNFAINGMVLSVLLAGGYMLNQGNLTAGDLMSFLVASQNIQKSLATISTLLSQVVKASTAKQRIFEMLKLEAGVASPNLSELRELHRNQQKDFKKGFEARSSSVEFENVFFEYPNREGQVLNKINLKIPAGTIVALCGESGAGKSTLASLLQRLYDPVSGRILIDNHDIKSIPISKLRTEHIGLVSQQPRLFATSIMENIRYGRPGASDKEVIEAAKAAQAHQFILEFKDGYQTMVGERGGEALSGGQRQRVAIARALLKNPKILILDEATSALDANSEVQVQKALKTIMEGRTVIIIAHRLSTIRHSNQIVVMSKGNIVEMGTHDELMKRDSYYKTLVQQQAKKQN